MYQHYSHTSKYNNQDNVGDKEKRCDLEVAENGYLFTCILQTTNKVTKTLFTHWHNSNDFIDITEFHKFLRLI